MDSVGDGGREEWAGEEGWVEGREGCASQEWGGEGCTSQHSVSTLSLPRKKLRLVHTQVRNSSNNGQVAKSFCSHKEKIRHIVLKRIIFNKKKVVMFTSSILWVYTDLICIMLKNNWLPMIVLLIFRFLHFIIAANSLPEGPFHFLECFRSNFQFWKRKIGNNLI